MKLILTSDDGDVIDRWAVGTENDDSSDYEMFEAVAAEAVSVTARAINAALAKARAARRSRSPGRRARPPSAPTTEGEDR